MLLLALALGVLSAAALSWAAPSATGRWPAGPVARRAAALPALGAAALAVAGGGRPTGWVPLDVALLGTGAALVVLAVPRAGRWAAPWVVAVTAAASWAGDGGLAALAAVATAGIVLGATLAGHRLPIVDVTAVAVCVAALAHLAWPAPTGASAAVALLALVPVPLAALARSPDRTRQVAGAAALAGAVVVVAGTLVAAVSLAAARADLDRAVDAARAGVELVGEDDPAARELLGEAAGRFDAAASTLGAWWARPALLVPGVAQHARAATTAAETGTDLVGSAQLALDEVDLDASFVRDGGIDLDVVAALGPPLDRSAQVLARSERRLADVRSPWLVPPVARRLGDLVVEVGELRASADLAVDLVAVAPDLLGGDAPKRYLLVLHTPAELRGTGGFMGSWGELSVRHGRFDLTRTGRIADLSDGGPDPAGRRIEGEPEFVARYGQLPARNIGLVAQSPDFPTVARILHQLHPQAGGSPIDGVIATSPHAFARFLELTGPVEVPGHVEPLRADRVEDIMLHESYLEFQDLPRDVRGDFLVDAAEALLGALTTGELPGLRATGDVLGEAVRARSLQVWVQDPAGQRALTDLGVAGQVDIPRLDGIGIVGQNYGGDKLDYFLRRSVAYDLTWDPATGAVEGTIDVSLANTVPDGMPVDITGLGNPALGGAGEPGENLHLLSLYAAVDLGSVTLDGEPAEVDAGTELGHSVRTLYVPIPPGGERRVRAEVRGQLPAGRAYELALLRQHTSTPDEWQVRLRLAPGWQVREATGADAAPGDGTVEVAWSSRRPERLQVLAERAP